MTINQISMAKLKSRCIHEQFRTWCVLRAEAGLYFERLSLKNINYFKLGVNEHVITHFHDFSKTFRTYVFSMTFPGLEMTILKFHDFPRFSMTVRTLVMSRQLLVTNSRPEFTGSITGWTIRQTSCWIPRATHY